MGNVQSVHRPPAINHVPLWSTSRGRGSDADRPAETSTGAIRENPNNRLFVRTPDGYGQVRTIAHGPTTSKPLIDLMDLKKLIGYQFPGGSYTIEHYRNWLVNDVVGAEQRDDRLAHPMFCYFAALASMGLSLGDLFSLAGASADDGVMFGEAEIEIRRPLRVGETFEVSGEIITVDRKEGRKTGVFDVVGFELRLAEDGAVVGVSRNSFVFPRG
jgi:hypothetical protein